MQFCLSLICLLLIAPACLGVYICNEPSCQKCKITEPEDIKKNFDAIVTEINMSFESADVNGDGVMDEDEMVHEMCNIDEDEDCPQARLDFIKQIYLQVKDPNGGGVVAEDVLPYVLALLTDPDKYPDSSFESLCKFTFPISLVFHYYDYNRDGLVELGVGDGLAACDHNLQYRNFDWAKFTTCMQSTDGLLATQDCDGNGVITLSEMMTVVNSCVMTLQ